MANTAISYLYRDTANYKIWSTAIVSGAITEEQRQQIAESLADGEYFYPADVGLPANDFVSEGYVACDDDPDFFEMSAQNIVHTELPPTVDMTIDELVQRFVASKESWASRF